MRRGGQYAQIGLFGKPVAWDLDQVCYKELSVTRQQRLGPLGLDARAGAAGGGPVQTEPLISGVYPLDGVARGLRQRSSAARGLKTLLQPVG